jgi:hypothetical protein
VSSKTDNDRVKSNNDSNQSEETSPLYTQNARAKAGEPSDNVYSDNSRNSHTPGYSSGASTPVDSRSLDGSSHGSRDRAMSKTLGHSNSVLGLDNLIEARKEEGDLVNNMVHIEVSGRHVVSSLDITSSQSIHEWHPLVVVS